MLCKEKKKLIDFATTCNCFDSNEKLKLILFATGAKQVSYVVLKVFPKKPDIVFKFDKMLKDAGFLFKKSSPKTFEEITSVKNNEIRWDVKGVWIGYDLFNDKKQEKEFGKYLSLISKGKHSEADRIAGKLYGYPKSCIDAFIKNFNNPKNIAKKYSYQEYYKFLHDAEKKFPFIQHRPHSLSCKGTISLNNKYKNAVKKYAPEFFKNFSRKRTYKTEVIVDMANDIMINNRILKEGLSIWPVKKARDYIFITNKKVENEFWLLSHLSNDFIERGTVLSAELTLQYNYSILKLDKVKKQLNDLFHERKFPAQRR